MATMFERTSSSYGRGTQQQLTNSQRAVDAKDTNNAWQSIEERKAADALNRKPAPVKKAATKKKVKQETANTNAESATSADSQQMPVNTAEPVGEVFKRSYPSDLPSEDGSYYLQIMLGDYNQGVALSDMSTVQHDVSIVLPVPANLMTATALDYSNVELGALGGEALNALRAIDGAGDKLQALRDQTNNLARELFKSGDSGLRQMVFRRMVAQVSPTLGSAVDLVNGSTPNPHIAVTFNNVKFRSFAYTWKFSPNSPGESVTLNEIIQKLNQRILPKKSGNLLLKYPNQCKLKLFPYQLNTLFKFKPCVIESMRVNYAPSGSPSFFAGTQLPTEIELSINFQEIQIRTSEDYN